MTAALASASADRNDFMSRYLRSPKFMGLYSEVMSAVERCASYLDGPGRAYAKTLDATAQAAYSRTSMWMTIGLMRAASVVLVLRSVGSGEMTLDHGMSEIRKTDAARPMSRNHDPEVMLPVEYARILEDYLTVREKVDRLAAKIFTPPSPAANPALEWLATLEREFCTKRPEPL